MIHKMKIKNGDHIVCASWIIENKIKQGIILGNFLLTITIKKC